MKVDSFSSFPMFYMKQIKASVCFHSERSTGDKYRKGADIYSTSKSPHTVCFSKRQLKTIHLFRLGQHNNT